jgi:hypothetical protein
MIARKNISFLLANSPVILLLAVIGWNSLFSSATAQSVIAEKDTCGLRISLLTCTPGQELYSIFGHTAIRVTDASSDLVFNYGTFQFNDPDFYTKFVRGKLAYFLSVENFADFEYAYRWEQRGITEQVLSLTCKEKEDLFRALIVNAQESNKYYKYDFLFDNCTTRAGDIIIKNNQKNLATGNILGGNSPTFRELLHIYLDKGGMVWSKLGIDILLGSRIDREVTKKEYMFLPDNLMWGMDSTKSETGPVVLNKSVIVEQTWKPGNPPLEPIWWFMLPSLLLLLATYQSRTTYGRWQKNMDRIFFSLLGLMGILLTFMWWGTDHASCRDNYNLLWCLPTHLLFIWLPKRSQNIQKKYFLAIAGVQLLLLLSWPLLPQDLNRGLIPIVALAAARSVRIARK